jgi:beta-phosphoglucomutase-like phosphatase (HAD superfamily)
MTNVLFFDLDGTLADTHAVHLATWMEVLRPHGVEVDVDLYRQRLLGKPNDEAVRELLPDLPDEELGRLLEREAESYRGRTKKIGPVLGLGELLEEGRRRRMELVLVTNAPKSGARESLEALGLADAFDLMVFAEEVGREKPHPAPYQEALGRLGTSAEEALAFEDSPKGVASAVEAGVPVVGLVSTHTPTELREAGAEFLIGDFADPAVYERLGR